MWKIYKFFIINFLIGCNIKKYVWFIVNLFFKVNFIIIGKYFCFYLILILSFYF